MKLLKPVLVTLRARGLRLIAYLDDSLIIASSNQEVEMAYQESKTPLNSSGVPGIC